METSDWLSFSEFNFNVEPINEPRLNGFLLDIRWCGGALKGHGNDEAIAQICPGLRV